MKLALFPGTFDPFTLGHLDVLRRALSIFDTVEVTVAVNETKEPLMSRVSKKRRESQAAVLPLPSVLEVVVREELRNFVIEQGMAALTRILEEERTALCGAPYDRDSPSPRRAGSGSSLSR